MLKPTPLKTIAVVTIVLGLLLLAAWQSGLTGDICEKTASQQNEKCATHSLALFLVIKLGEFLDNNDGLITALATLAIAAFTFTLWTSTRDLGIAGEKQLESLKQSEMANIVVRRVEFIKDKGPTHRPRFRIFFQNFGKTPGFIHTTRLHFAPARSGNEPGIIDAVKENARGGSYNNGFLLPPGAPQPAGDTYGDRVLNAEEFNRLEASKDEQLFVWGEVEFSPIFGETIYGERWISQFAYRINLTPVSPPKTSQKNVSVGGAGYWRYYQKPSESK
ncbi:hypothetical protein NKJ81_28905 [Mesorhizobium sp. M0018]|uniref:hypothetical protein n=1 Tax=Mesorhizobium sp. M0018 TaxID=2956844 RepID=UPI003338BD09